MLMIEKKQNPVADVVFILVTFALVAACSVWIVTMSNQALKHSCGQIEVSEYQANRDTLPQTCVTMWKSGKL